MNSEAKRQIYPNLGVRIPWIEKSDFRNDPSLCVQWVTVIAVTRVIISDKIRSTAELNKIRNILTKLTPEQRDYVIKSMERSWMTDEEIQFYFIVPDEPDFHAF